MKVLTLIKAKSNVFLWYVQCCSCTRRSKTKILTTRAPPSELSLTLWRHNVKRDILNRTCDQGRSERVCVWGGGGAGGCYTPPPTEMTRKNQVNSWNSQVKIQVKNMLDILRFWKSKLNDVSFLRLGILYARQDNMCDFFPVDTATCQIDRRVQLTGACNAIVTWHLWEKVKII